MSCPDINRLIDLLGDPQSDVELLAHLELWFQDHKAPQQT